MRCAPWLYNYFYRIELRAAHLDRAVAVVLAPGLARILNSMANCFHLIGSFNDAFEDEISFGPTSQRLRESLEELTDRLQRIPLTSLFSPERVIQICLTADGIDPSLLGPEKGVRMLITRAVHEALAPSLDAVDEVARQLVAAATMAARRSAAAADHLVFEIESESAPSGGGGDRDQVMVMKRASAKAKAASTLQEAAASAIIALRHLARELVENLCESEAGWIDPGAFYRCACGLNPGTGTSRQSAPAPIVSLGTASSRSLAPAVSAGDSGLSGPAREFPNQSARPGISDIKEDAAASSTALAQNIVIDSTRRLKPVYRAAAALVDYHIPAHAGILEKCAREGGGPWASRWCDIYRFDEHSQPQLRLFRLSDRSVPSGVVDLRDSVVTLGAGGAEAPSRWLFSSQNQSHNSMSSSRVIIIEAQDGRPVIKQHKRLVLRAATAESAALWASHLTLAADSFNSMSTFTSAANALSNPTIGLDRGQVLEAAGHPRADSAGADFELSTPRSDSL